MEMADNPKLVMAESTGPEKTSLSDTPNRFQYSTAKKSDSFVVDMETFNEGANKDINANSRITLQRNHSKKGVQRGEKKTNSSINYANDTIIASSPRGSSMPEKPTVMATGTTDYSNNPQVHHQITITTGNIITTTPDSSRCAIRRNSFKRSSSSLWVLDPKRVLLFFATLSSMGTMLLIYFTLSMSKYNADEITLD